MITFSWRGLLCLLSCILPITIDACTKIIVECTNPDIDWLNGTFLLDATMVADGRPVYVESFEEGIEEDHPRRLYHYSHEQIEEPALYDEANFDGRWILGNNVYSADGWFYISSWSISPSHRMMRSLLNLQETPNKQTTDNAGDDEDQAIMQAKLEWNMFANDSWSLTTPDVVQLKCESQFDDITQDWLFVHTPNKFAFNVLNKNYEDVDDTLHSITRQTLYGFYYRVSDEWWRKIESNIFFRRRDLKNDPVNKSWLSRLLSSSLSLGASSDKPDVEYSFLLYDNFTNPDGTPDMDKFSGNKIVTYAAYGDALDVALREKPWVLIKDEEDTNGGNEQQQQKGQPEAITVHIVKARDENDDIYAAFRRYWKQVKLNSFHKVTTELAQAHRDKLVVETNNGLPFMMMGLGTGGLRETDASQSMWYAVNEVGYRLIDGAQAYENEAALGLMLRDPQRKVERDELYITSKVWPTHLGFVQTYQVILDSLNKLKTNYIDLYMIHWNRCNPDISWMHCEGASDRPWGQSYQVMEKLYAEGILLNLGVSNYDFSTFNEMLHLHRIQVIPQVLQNYFDVAHADWDLSRYVARFGVIYQGYAQYRGIAQADARKKHGEVHYYEFAEKLREISKRVSDSTMSTAQVLLRWLLEERIAVIPRSRHKDHLKDNWNVWDYELLQEDMEALTQQSKEQNKKMHEEL